MPSNVIKVSIVADNKGFEAGIKKTDAVVGGFFAGMGARIGTFALDMGGKALAAIKKFVDDSVRAFSDLEQATGGTEAVFGDLANQIGAVGKTAADTMGLSETEFRQATTSMGGQLKRMTGDVQLAADKSIFLTQVAADLAATYGGTTAEAVSALGAAFRGEADPAERFNLNLKIGAQNAKAVEMGLADTTAEVDDHARALALVELITEQSADAQGQFARELDTVAGKQAVYNAKLEDAKALFGRSLAPAKNLFTSLQTAGVGVLTDLAQAFGSLTGEMSIAESKMIDFQQEIARGADPLEAFATQVERMAPAQESFAFTIEKANDGLVGAVQVVEEVKDRYKEFFDLQAQGGMAVEDMRRTLEQMNRTGTLTDEMYRLVLDALGDWQEKTRQQTQDIALLNSATERYTNRAKNAKDATLDLGAATEYSRQQLVEFREEQKRGLDVSSDFITALDRQKEAQEAYTEAVKEHGPASEEAREAALNMAEANGAVIDSALAVAEQYPDVFEGMFQELLDSGVAPATARAIVDQAQAQFDKNPIHVRLAVQPVKWTQQGQSAIPVKDGPRQFFHSGGVVPGPKGTEVAAVLKAGETVLPTHDIPAGWKLNPDGSIEPADWDSRVKLLNKEIAAAQRRRDWDEVRRLNKILKERWLSYQVPEGWEMDSTTGEVRRKTPTLDSNSAKTPTLDSNSALGIPGGITPQGPSQPLTINLTVQSLDPRESYRLVLEALQEIERRFGGLPVNVRVA